MIFIVFVVAGSGYLFTQQQKIITELKSCSVSIKQGKKEKKHIMNKDVSFMKVFFSIFGEKRHEKERFAFRGGLVEVAQKKS